MRELRLDGKGWAKKHWHSIQAIYGKRPFFKSQAEAILRPWFERADFDFMVDAAIDSTLLLSEVFGAAPFAQRSSELPGAGAKGERILSLCEALETKIYYSALGGTQYLDYEAFRARGIRVITQNWKSPLYDQGRESCVTTLSAIDALANVPLEEIRGWISPKSYGPFSGKAAIGACS